MMRKMLERGTLLAVAALGAIGGLGRSSHAAVMLYDDFNYTVGDRLGGSGTNPLGQIAPNGEQWITRSPAAAGSWVAANDTLITAGSLSYPGLATSSGNSVRFGSSAAGGGAGKYTDSIRLPGGGSVSSGSLYYSAIVRFNGDATTPAAVAPGGVRHSYASFSTDTANPLTDAGFGVGTSSGTGGIPLPAGAWLRDSGATDFHFGSGKQNSDGMGPSASLPSWQSSAAGHPFPNQQGNTAGTGQDELTIAADTWFIVMKYTFNASATNNDTVSMWVNPIASTLGDNSGEAAAGSSGGSYYSAVNANVTTAGLDAAQIRSFMLLGLGQASAANVNKSIDTTLDELRIGDTWADVTPAVPEPASAAAVGLIGAGMLARRRRS